MGSGPLFWERSVVDSLTIQAEPYLSITSSFPDGIGMHIQKLKNSLVYPVTFKTGTYWSRTSLLLLVMILSSGVLWAESPGKAASHTLKTVTKFPKEIPEKLQKELLSEGLQVQHKEQALMTLWLRKSVPIKPNFTETFSVFYPLFVGDFVGVLQVESKEGTTDFRGQELKPGFYSLRYAQQPEDGDHLGTSDTSDFLVGIPLKADVKTDRIADVESLFKMSAKASGSTHPAIFALLPSKKAPAKTLLEHDEDKDFWIWNTSFQGAETESKSKPEKKAKSTGLRLVAIGESEG